MALDAGYECHSCGATYAAGLVRVPRAWGAGGEAMASSARRELPYPDAAVIEQDTLDAQNAALADALPAPPLVLGGCCCSHVGAIRGLARGRRLAAVWLDAHGDLNTPETSPSGNAWGMPLRMAIDAGDVRAEDVALVGARSLDAGELAFLDATGVDDDVERALRGTDAVYVALDVDVLDPQAVAVFMPEPGGLAPGAVERLLGEIVARAPLAGLGLTGHVPETETSLLTRLAAAAGL